MSKKILAMFMATAMAATTFFGCGSTEEASKKDEGSSTTSTDEDASTKTDDEKVTLEVAVSGSAQEIAIHQQKFDLYMKEHPNVTIKPVDIGSERFQKLMTLIGADNAPDIIYLNEWTYVMANKGVLLGLNDLIEQEQFDTSVYPESLLTPLRYEGELYALPQEVSPFVIYYNKEMFEAANVPLPTDDWTIDEFYAAAEALTDPAEKVYGYRHPGAWADQVLGWLSRAGVDFDISGKEVKGLDTPEALNALTFLYDLVVKDELSPNPAALTAMGKGADAMFRNQKVAMESAGLWMLPTYKENPLPFEWDVVRMPMDKNQNTKAGILNWGISKSTKNPEAAWDLLKFLCGPEGNRIVAFGIFSSSVFYLYRLICKPLNQFQKQMIQVGNGSLQEAEQEYEIKEFDDLMHEVEQMKEQIRNLIDDVVEKEKSIQRTEYEKLLYQINPHFLLNTLNSVQWMARMSKQDNITEFVQRLKRLLSYNLGKEGMQTTLRTEIDIVKDYIALEQMRYDFVIEMNVEEGRYLEQPTVRMLLQPLVENAIRYGLGDDEKITIQVFEDNIRGLAIITILDSGNGLTQEEINEPFDYDVKKMQHGNRGIGLRYVKAMLESFYEGETNLFVNCKKGYGTKITILIPIQEELRNKIKFTGSGTEKEGMEK